MTTSPDRDAIVAALRADVDSLRAFRNAEVSHLGRTSHRAMFMITRERVSSAVVTLGHLAARPRLTEVALRVVQGMNPHAGVRDWEAGLFQSAARALGEPFVDVERATGPEPSRWSDATSPHRVDDKLLVLETIRSLCDGWTGPGWAANLLAVQLGVVLPQIPVRL